MKRLVLLGLSLAMLLTLLCGCGAKRVDMSDYIKLEANGYNGYARSDYFFDSDALDSQVGAEKINKYVQKVMPQEYAFESSFGETYSTCDIFDCSIDKSADISNGDTITATLSLSSDFLNAGETMKSAQKALGISFKKDQVSLKVEGLEEAKVLDAFACIDGLYFFHGGNGHGEVKFNLTDYSKDNPLAFEKDGFHFIPQYPEYGHSVRDVTFQLVYDNKNMGTLAFASKDNTLSNGDQASITLTADGVSSSLASYGYVLAQTVQSYTVSGLGEYVASKDQLSTANLQGVIDRGVAYATAEQGLNNTSCVSLYLGTLKSVATSEYNGKCCLAVVMSFNPNLLFGGVSNDTYYAVQYLEDLVLLPDNSLDGAFTDFKYNSSSVDNIISGLRSDYTYEKIQ